MQSEASLEAFLAGEALLPITRKRWFSEEYVRLGDYLRRAQVLFEAGVVLGFSFRDRLGVLAGLFGLPGKEEEHVTALASLAATHLAQLDPQPHDFLDVFFKPEADRWTQRIKEEGRSQRSGWASLPKLDRKRMTVADMQAALQMAFRKGVAVGALHPQFAEKLFSAVPGSESWSCFRGRSSELPTTPPPAKSFEAREFDAKSLIIPYIEENRPDLLARLGLWPSAGSDVRLRMRALRARMSPRPDPQL